MSNKYIFPEEETKRSCYRLDDQRTKSYRPEFHKIKKQIAAEQHWKCARCHASLWDAKTNKIKSNMQLHHIDHSGKTEHENNDRTNLLYLCGNCHRVIHMNHLLSVGILRLMGTRVENAFFDAECKYLWHKIRNEDFNEQLLINLSNGDVEFV